MDRPPASHDLDVRPLEQTAERVVLAVSGELDVATAPTLGARLQAVAAGAELVLDLGGVVFMDSSGLRVLIAERDRRGALEVVRPAPVVARLLDLAGLAEHFGVTPAAPVPDGAGEPTSGPPPAATVELRLPGEVRFLRLARLVASGLAAELGSSVEGVEDVRVAIDELSAVLLSDLDAGSTDLELTFRTDGHDLVVEGSCRAPAGSAPAPDGLAAELLGLITDRWDVSADGDRRSFRFEVGGER